MRPVSFNIKQKVDLKDSLMMAEMPPGHEDRDSLPPHLIV